MPPLLYPPTAKTALGVFENNSTDDIFQIVGPGGAVQSHMISTGRMDPQVGQTLGVVMITSAQIKALNTTSVQLVPAPGPGLAIVLAQYAAVFNYVAPAYTNIGGDGSLYVGYGTTPAAVIANQVDASAYAFIEQSSSQLSSVSISASYGSLANATNAPLSIATLDTLATGNGTVKFGFAYYVVSVS